MRDPEHTFGMSGRVREQRLLLDLLPRAESGNGGLMLIGGEAGIGKTTLVSWLAEQARCRGIAVLTGGNYDLQTTPPFGPWIEMFKGFDLCAERGARLIDLLAQSTGQEHSLLHHGASDHFERVRNELDEAAAVTPILLVLEDMHWADPASLDLLRYVSRYISQSRIMIAVTYRPGEAGGQHSMHRVFPLLVREGRADRLDLANLREQDIRDILTHRYTLVPSQQERLKAYLLERSEGNPFFLGEVLRELESARCLTFSGGEWVLGDLQNVRVPHLVKQIVQQRAGQLDDDVRQMLGVASIIGYSVPLELWQNVTGMEHARLDLVVTQAVASRLIIAEPDNLTVRFQHALVREAMYETLSPVQKRRWHAEVADALLGSAGSDPDMLAHHFRLSGDPRALEWLIRAGMRALDASAWISAADRFREAAELLDGSPVRQREQGWLLFMSGFLLRYSSSRHTLVDLDAAMRLAIASGDNVLFGFVRYHRGASRAMRGEIRRGLVELEDGVDALDAMPDVIPHESTESVAVNYIRSIMNGDLRPLGDKPNEREADQSRHPAPQRGILINWLGHSGHFRRSREIGEWFFHRTRETVGDDHLRVYQSIAGHLGLGHAYGALGMPDESRREYDIALEWFARTGVYVEVQFTIWSDIIFSAIPYRADDMQNRQRLRSLIMSNWARSASLSISGPDHGAPGEILLNLLDGRWDEARQAAEDSRSDTYLLAAKHATAVLGWLCAHQGDRDLAWECIFEVLPDGYATEPGNTFYSNGIMAQMTAATLSLEAGDLDEARRWLDANREWLAWSEAVLWVADHHIMQSRIAALAGDTVGAITSAEVALRHASEPRQPLALCASYRQLGAAHLDAGGVEAARRYLGASLTLADSCEAPFERAQTLFVMGQLLVKTGQIESAREAFAKVQSICTMLRASSLHGTASDVLQRLDASINPMPDGHPLSPRELDVIRLIVDGQSNREIADSLFISPRTVASHVASIMNKLGVDSRTAAAAWAIRHGLD